MLLIIPIAGSTWALGIMTYIHLLPTSKQLPCWLQQTAEARRVWRREEEGSHHPLASHTHGHQAARKEAKQKRTRMSPGDPQHSPVSQLLEAWQDLQPELPQNFYQPSSKPCKMMPGENGVFTRRFICPWKGRQRRWSGMESARSWLSVSRITGFSSFSHIPKSF